MSVEQLADPRFELKPIATIHTDFKLKFDAPHQPAYSKNEKSIIEFLPDFAYSHTTKDLETFSHIWLIWMFHKNCNWKPLVCPPRGPEVKRGVFATRSPYRPNNIGISVVELVEINKNKLIIGSHDLIDGTPIIDIKPYIPSIDSFPNASLGWTKEIENEIATKSKFQIVYQSPAKEQLAWFASKSINFIERAEALLSIDPTENKTRRIKKIDSNLYRMGCGGWRIFFSVRDDVVEVKYFNSGYPKQRLNEAGHQAILNFSEHLEFYEKWSGGDKVV